MDILEEFPSVALTPSSVKSYDIQVQKNKKPLDLEFPTDKLVTDLEDFIKESLMKAVTLAAFVLVIVGALNWGLVGLFRFNLVQALFGESALSSIVYALVGIAGVVLAARAATSPALVGVESR
jgi:uncharacterized membrane protein YuzA (DUF378 family)